MEVSVLLLATVDLFALYSLVVSVKGLCQWQISSQLVTFYTC